jgi:beta-lactamase class A
MSLLHQNYEMEILKIVDEYRGVIGIHAVSLGEKGEIFAFNPVDTFPTASIIKVPMLMEYYRKVEAGKLDPKEEVTLPEEYICGGSGVLQHLTTGVTRLTLEDYVTLMIISSDNVATNLIYNKVGQEDVNRLLHGLGLEGTKLSRKMQAYRDISSDNENITTPEDMTTLLTVLYTGEGVSEFVARSTLDKLKIWKEGMIRDAIPDGVEVADKSGWMGGVHCNTGIVYHPGNNYVVTIMFKHIPKSDERGLSMRTAARKILGLIHEYYDEVGSSSKYGIRL